MKQSDIDVIIARRERRVRNFFLWFWLLVVPALAVVLYFGFFSRDQPHHSVPPQVPTYNCASAAASLSNIDPGGQIAPLCGATPYPNSGGG